MPFLRNYLILLCFSSTTVQLVAPARIPSPTVTTAAVAPISVDAASGNTTGMSSSTSNNRSDSTTALTSSGSNSKKLGRIVEEVDPSTLYHGNAQLYARRMKERMSFGSEDFMNYMSLKSDAMQVILEDIRAFLRPTSPCPEGWVYERELKNCYYFSRTVQTWINSKVHCETMGGKLATILNEAEMSYIFEYGKKTAGLGEGPWIGMKEVELSIPVWIDFYNQIKPPSTDRNEHRLKLTGKPNFVDQIAPDPKLLPGENGCIHLSGGLNGYWQVKRCGHLLHFICKKMPNIPTNTAPKRPSTTPKRRRWSS